MDDKEEKKTKPKAKRRVTYVNVAKAALTTDQGKIPVGGEVMMYSEEAKVYGDNLKCLKSI